MCIRDSVNLLLGLELLARLYFILDSVRLLTSIGLAARSLCLLYTSDAADERSSVDLGGRRIIKKKKYYRGGGTRRSERLKRKAQPQVYTKHKRVDHGQQMKS